MEGKIAGAVFTFSVEGILSKVASLAAQELSLAWGFKAELKRLHHSLLTIQDFLQAVSDQPQDRVMVVEEWVRKLKAIAQEADDVLDEFEYEVVRRKVELQNHMKKKVLNFFSLSNPFAFRLKMAHKIKNINQSLVDLKGEASFIGLVSKRIDATPRGNRWDRQTNAFIGRDEITVGREDDVSKIVTNLTDARYNQENLAVMAIVGMGGIGKTTLAKSVYNEDLIHKFFETKIWVCVSNTFDVNLILLQMLEQLNPTKVPSKDNQNALLMFLNEELKDKRYLLVLDDVWNEDSEKWNNLMECLFKLKSAGGSKIIVTTRSTKVASISEKLLRRHGLEKLTVDECWSIMKKKAFPNSSAHIVPQLKTIGMEIAENCGGIPLVAKVLGGILHTKNSIAEWLLFKESGIWNNLPKGEDRIMSVLKLSFDNLESPSLKQCFAYCSMFKKDFEIQRENLIQLWMAQGLLRPSLGESKDMEDIGNEYFEILLQSSLFQDATLDYNGIISECKMHDLVHDLAKLVSRFESLTGDFHGIDNTDEIRHVARVSSSILKTIPERSAGKLRSLVFEEGEVPINILPRFKALRILNLSNANIEEFPTLVERLKHLRYLDISKTRFKLLPSSIGKLYNLQTLRATNCALQEFPKELQNLINLRHIYFDESTKFPQGLRWLTCLRTLPYFSVGNEIGRRIEELAGLKELKGELVVCNLEHVDNGEEAKKAKLEDKKKVCHLTLRWTRYRSTTNNNDEGDVLEGLQPHPDLESLSIENFMGDKFPLWMMSRPLQLNNLKKIQLFGCNKCEAVPPLGHLPNLTELKISGMANLKSFGVIDYDLAPDLFGSCGSLERLIIRNCEKLRQLPDGLDTLPFLEYLGIYRCPNLELIPITQGMASLRRLEIYHCEQLSRLPSGLDYCTSLQKLVVHNCSGLSGPLSGLQGCTSLVELFIWRCNNLTSIEIKGGASLTSLQKLTIRYCDELSSLPALPQHFPSLQQLYISECPKLSSFGVQSSSIEEKCVSDLRAMIPLQQLRIEYCEGSESWVSGLQFPVSLEWLAINDFPNLEILPSLDNLNSLCYLEIRNWRKLKYLPAGLRWLSHLKKLQIGPFWEELDSFPDFGVGSLMHLTMLDLWGWPKLKSLPQQIQHFTSLTDLMIVSFDGVETLPEWLGNLTSLTQLEIQDCKNLSNLPSVEAIQRLTELQILDISGCHPLLEQKCTRDSGTDWPKIAHIPNITIKSLGQRLD
ncbi:disease resistance protein RGA2-like [Pyrus communis]|uniref:disease resistance protein RGA2-like n=1 Tax=Pyrus communis TaxID=23211 RepID=UPI0035BEB91F